MPPHAINFGLNLEVAATWEAGPEPGGCHGTGVYDDLHIGTPVKVSTGGKTVASGSVTRTKNLIAGCALVATIDAVPAAKSYSFQFGDHQAHEVSYADVAKSWNVVVTP